MRARRDRASTGRLLITAPRASLGRHLINLAPLRESPAFARMRIGGTVTGIGSQMTIPTVGLDVYARTESTLA